MEGKRAVEYAEKRRLWQGRLDEWKDSGLSQAAYCRFALVHQKVFIPQSQNQMLLVELPNGLSRPGGEW
ncbi:MAG: hypothetical protein P4L43_04030 [Syntrophobacteraceae bacterium]|nr:hypothetical protein [Syntrophobacteraceae bacterium]